MKILTTLAIVFLLSACAGMLAPDFDSNEYGQFVNLHSDATYLKGECGSDHVVIGIRSMKYDSGNLLTYATHIPNNDEITGMAKIVDDDLAQMKKRSESGMTKGYCELKFDQLVIKLNKAIKSIGAL